MARMQRLGFSFLSLTAVLMTGVGCVPQEKYNAARLALDAANERFATADAQSKAATAEAEAYRRQLEAIMADGSNKNGLVGNLSTQLAELQARYSELERQYNEALNRQGVVQVLPEAVNNALTDFANQNPDLVDFDSARGVVKFKSDVTFNTGSAELKSNARTAIARFAQILNSPVAAGYELQVAGHTDSQPVQNPATKKAGHLDNWYLSSHRAIAVGKALQEQRVSPQRIAVVGYAEQHPIASNATEQGRAQNRRVEVLITPNQVRTAGAGEGAPAPAKAGRDAAATIDRGPSFNK
jgi:chemotaxis protein MotB